MARSAAQNPEREQIAEYVFDHLAQLVMLLEKIEETETALMLDTVVRIRSISHPGTKRDQAAPSAMG